MLIYRGPQRIKQQIRQENDPKPISLIGAQRGGVLTSFAEAAKSGMANGR